MEIREIIGARILITVSGAHSGVGKTALAEMLMHHLPDFAAIKVTITDHVLEITDDERELMVPGKDTWRLRKSGAVQVVWVKSPEDVLQASLKAALVRIAPCRGILIEGNSILRYLDPALSFFVVTAGFNTMKQSRVEALRKADVCVINQVKNPPAPDETVARVRSHNPRLVILSINLLEPARTAGDDYERLLTLLNDCFG